MRVEMHDITVSFGGNIAVNSMSLEAREGSIVGLIGPNGAGKSTVINVLSGFIAPNKGKVIVEQRDVTKKSPQLRAHYGIGRTFQQVRLCEESTVMENLMYAAEAILAGRNPIRMVWGRRGDAKSINERIESALVICGLEGAADTKVEDLSTGQRRLVELSRCLVNQYRILLLDEPAAGLDERETEAMGNLLRDVVSKQGLGVLLVEHDMSLVLGICENVYVMDFGQLIFSGSALEARHSTIVQDAYLGVM